VSAAVVVAKTAPTHPSILGAAKKLKILLDTDDI